MSVLFGRKRPYASICAVCADGFGYRGKSLSGKYPKDHEIIWVCDNCTDPKIWNRIYSMRHSQLDDIENACVQMAARTLAKDIVSAVLTGCDKETIDKVTDRVLRNGNLHRPLKAYLDEFSVELKKWIS